MQVVLDIIYTKIHSVSVHICNTSRGLIYHSCHVFSMVYQLYTIVYIPFIQPFYFDLQCDDIFEMDVDHKKHNETYLSIY